MPDARDHEHRPYRLGVDVGGTFTDVLLIDERTGATHRAKVPTTVEDQSIGVLTGVERACGAAAIDVADLGQFLHGTTVATNAVLERKGARVGLLVTRGFRQVLHVARSFVPGGLGGWITWDRPAPLVDLRDTEEVPERTGADGTVVEALDEAATADALGRLGAAGIEALTVAFVNAYANPENERRAAALARELLPGVAVSISSDILPELGEYERTLTTVANSYVRPTVSAYLTNLSDQLGRRGLRGERRVLRSDGGLMAFPAAGDAPVNLLMSGPAGGVAAAVALGPVAGFPDLLTLDMGGTSTDVALVEGGTPGVRRETAVADLVVRAPSIDVRTVGAGGGSIAHVPELTRALRVGPESAGAVPGPVAYGRGGTEPTVTDANVVLGHLPTAILGGEMQLDVDAARSAVGRIGAALGLSTEEAAAAIVGLVDESMLGALRLVSVQQGHDPRRFALFPFGGAGPLHANSLASLIGSWPVVVPPSPGVLAAYGDAATSLRAEASQSLIRRFDVLDPRELSTALAHLRDAVVAELEEAGSPPEGRSLVHEVDVRYHGQGFQVAVAAEVDGAGRLASGLDALGRRFDEVHLRLFGFDLPEEHETVSVRVIATAARPHVDVPRLPEAPSPEPRDAVVGPHRMYVGGGWADALLLDRARLLAGHRFDGPAVVTEMDSTTVVLPGSTAVVDGWGNLVISPSGESSGRR